MILAKYSSFAKILQGCCDRWKNLRTLLRELRHDPYYVSKYPIPLFEGDTGIFNNLPSPDFDDTGFIGRQVELAELLAALEGPYPVITIIGEGGVGKTALALKACYTLIDAMPQQFEGIIWVTAKANRLTPRTQSVGSVLSRQF
jgi:LuxR family transcriptional regulator, glucitol operon activator